MELELSILNLLLEYKKKWIWFFWAIFIGAGISFTFFKILKKKYSSEVVFLANQGDLGGQSITNLGLLSGKLGLGGEAQESPFITHFEDVIKTRNFKLKVRKIVFEDTTYAAVRKLFQENNLSSDKIFVSELSGLIRIKLKDGIYNIEALTTDPQASLELSEALFKAFDSLIREEKRRDVMEDYGFIQGLVAQDKTDLDDASDALRIFLEKNLDVSSPKLEQEKQQYILNTKLAEQKYITSINDLEDVKIKMEKQQKDLIVIDNAFLNKIPTSPKLEKLLAICIFVSILTFLIIIGFIKRNSWILISSSQKEP